VTRLYTCGLLGVLGPLLPQNTVRTGLSVTAVLCNVCLRRDALYGQRRRRLGESVFSNCFHAVSPSAKSAAGCNSKQPYVPLPNHAFQCKFTYKLLIVSRNKWMTLSRVNHVCPVPPHPARSRDENQNDATVRSRSAAVHLQASAILYRVVAGHQSEWKEVYVRVFPKILQPNQCGNLLFLSWISRYRGQVPASSNCRKGSQRVYTVNRH
jgi:hypothetical protein